MGAATRTSGHRRAVSHAGRRLALVLLAPVVVQILLFHVFLDTAGLPMAAVITAITAYLGFGVYGKAFAGVLQPKP